MPQDDSMEWPHEGLMKFEQENEEDNLDLERRKILPDETE